MGVEEWWNTDEADWADMQWSAVISLNQCYPCSDFGW